MSEEEETGQKTPRIVMDDREPEEIKQWLEKEGVVVEKRRLDVGDFVISSDVVVERKSSTDLTTSIIDNRLFEQIIRL